MTDNARAWYQRVGDDGKTAIGAAWSVNYYDPGLDPKSWLWQERGKAGSTRFRPKLHYRGGTERI